MDEDFKKLRDELLEIELAIQITLTKNRTGKFVEELNDLIKRKDTAKRKIIAYKMKNNSIVRKRS